MLHWRRYAPVPFYIRAVETLWMMCSAELPVTSAVPNVLLASVVCALVAGMVGHGVLRPLLEARGVTPWRVHDSLGALPLVLIGSALIGGGAAPVGWLFGVCGGIISPAVGAAAVAAVLAGVLMLRLGLLALRKLT